MKLTTISIFLCFSLIFNTRVSGQNREIQSLNPWIQANISQDNKRSEVHRIARDKYRIHSLKIKLLNQYLVKAPKESAKRKSLILLELPYPDGTFGKFRVWESPIMEEGLAKKYPEIKSYGGQGIDDVHATLRMDMSPRGFHAFIISADYQLRVEPFSNKNNTLHLSYYTKDDPNYTAPVECLLIDERLQEDVKKNAKAMAVISVGAELRHYRLAIATRGDLAQDMGWGTRAVVLANVTSRINEVNAVYERDLSIRFTLVAGTDKLFFLDPLTDPYVEPFTDGDLLDTTQLIIDDSIGTPNYDIGHLFKTNTGGLAGIGVVCKPATKAIGFSSYGSLKTILHEIGHQFNAPHSFNAETASCSGARAGSSAYEPASGSTIMSYNGICGTNNIPNPGTLTFFNVGAFDQIANYVLGGGNCYTTTPTGNLPPVVSVPAGGFFIPISTPFTLTGSAFDPDGNPLTYSWEQYDLGPAGDWNSPTGDAPIFRVFNPMDTGSRTFPQISDIITGDTTLGEIMPSYARNLNFRMFVRDNQPAGGGASFGELTFMTDGTAGPFVVTGPNTCTTHLEGSDLSVTWNVANSDNVNVNCQIVRIVLSSDGGFTFPDTLMASTANDGTEMVTLPVGICGSQNRIKVEAVDNIFFDISNADFIITSQVGTMTIDSLKADELMVIWDGGTAPHFDLLWGATGLDPGSEGTLVNNINAKNYTLGSLSANTTYDIYVRVSGGVSCWVGPFSIRTLLCDPLGLPFTENFEDEAGGLLPPCWDEDLPYGQMEPGWESHSGTTPSGAFGPTGPDGAHEGTQYIYFEASGFDGQEKFGYLLSPPFDLRKSFVPLLSFYYHFRGTSILEFKLQVRVTSESINWTDLWTVVGPQHINQNDPYTLHVEDLRNYTGKIIQIRFCLKTNDSRGDAALDLITLTETGLDCALNSMNINGLPIDANTYHAIQDVLSDGTVANISTVVFKAGQSISMNGNFTVEQGALFEALIENCPSPLRGTEKPPLIKG